MDNSLSERAGGDRPQPLRVNLEGIPQELRDIPQWVLWRYRETGRGWTKQPITPARTSASSTNPATWSTFPEALDAYLELEGTDGAAGIGIVVTEGDDLVGTDIDHATLEAAGPFLLNTYTERSPSGEGFRQIGRGRKPAGAGSKMNNPGPGVKAVEIYHKARFLTITGHRVDGAPETVELVQERLEVLCEKLWPAQEVPTPAALPGASTLSDDELVDRIRRSASREKFEALFDRGDFEDHSSADLSLCNLLAFWTGRDAGQIDRLFRQSALMRPKWDEHRGAQRYGELTIDRAIRDCLEVYTPPEAVEHPGLTFKPGLVGNLAITSLIYARANGIPTPDIPDDVELPERVGVLYPRAELRGGRIVYPDGAGPPIQSVEEALEAAGGISHDGKTHPLALYRPPPDDRPREAGFILNGILCDKTSFIGAYAGAGKTTAMAPLALIAAGLIEVPGINIYGWRRVVYISEHPEQLEMILAAHIKHHGIEPAAVWERIKIVEAVKMTAAAVAAVAPDYRALTVTHSAEGQAADFPPWVIVDTQSALFQVENENDNAQMGEIVATIKQQMALPVSVIAHTAKVHKHGDAQTMSIRGGGALEGDANQVLYLSIDPDTERRYIEIGAPKHRFVARWDALEMRFHVAEMPARDPFGRTVTTKVGYCTVEPVAKAERIERKQEAAQERQREAIKDAREAVLARVIECETLAQVNPTDPDCYPTKRTLSDCLEHPRRNVRAAVDELLREKRIEIGQRPKGLKDGPRDYLLPVRLRGDAAAQSAENRTAT